MPYPPTFKGYDMLTMVRRMNDLGTVSVSHIDTTEDALIRLGTTELDWSLAYLSEDHVPVIMFTRPTKDDPAQVPSLIHMRRLVPHDSLVIVTTLEDGKRTFWQVSKSGQVEQLMFY